MRSSADLGGSKYPPRPKPEVDNTLQDLQNFSYPTKTKFKDCFIIHSKYFPLKGVSPFRSLFFYSSKVTQPRPQVFSVNCSITCSGLLFWHHFDIIGSIWQNFWCHWFFPYLVNSSWLWWIMCVVFQSETGKYSEWIIMLFITPTLPS